MSLRNRELLNLLAVGDPDRPRLRQRLHRPSGHHLDGASLSYAALFLGLFVAAHLVTRIALPFADPYLLPMRRCSRASASR